MKKPTVGQAIVTGKTRLSWPCLFQAESYQGGKPKFKATLLWDKNDPKCMEDLKRLKAACEEVATKAFGSAKGVKLPFRKGEEKADKWDGYKDAIYVTATTSRRPGVVDAKLKQAEEVDIYPGCYVRAQLTPASYQQAGQNGVTFWLNHVQKLAEGDRLGGGGGSPESAFGEYSDAGLEEEPFADEEDTLGI